MKVDITHHDVASFGDDDNNQYVYILGGGKGGVETLVIGDLYITITEEQEEKIRYFFENT